MTLGDALGLSDTQERYLVRGLQLGLLGLTVYGLVTFQPGIAANGAFTLAITLLPALLRREYDYSMDAGLVLWITIAVVLHSAGWLGLYKQFTWYDEIAHTVSATVIAGLGYVSFRALEEHAEELDVPPEFRTVFILVFVLAFGVLWEILEFTSGGLAAIIGAKQPLMVKGIDDIVTDLVFNTVGAVIVAVWGTGYFGDLVSFLGGLLDSRSAG